ncbi:MAG TPA: L,D-transpeptidase family protein, partial [Chloroflexota bacterium]
AVVAVMATSTPPASPTAQPTATAAPTVTPAPTATPAPPPQPLVQSPTDPSPKVWYAGKDVTLSWTEPSGVDVSGYSYLVDQVATSNAPATVRTTDDSVTLSDLKDGAWYFHVRAVDASGQWGPTTTLQVKLDRVPLSVSTPKFSAFTFNPNFFTQDFWFDVSKPAQVTVVIQGSTGATVRTFHAQQPKAGEVDLTWDGKMVKGGIAQPGKYSYLITADDGHGHQASSQASGLSVTYDRIVVSLSQQSLTAYDSNTPVVSSLVTTGNQLLPTPVGVFPVLGKYSPFTFHSPWPKGSPLWYADSPVTYALLFDDRGYFIHDAPWRSDYGPGSNAQPGTPGQDLTGSHGCVNVPLAIAKQLYDWAPTGTAVQVVP